MHEINGYSLENFKLIDKHEASEILGISPETLKKYRLKPDSPFAEGIHYYKSNSRLIRWDAFLLVNWAINQNNPKAHQQAIELRLQYLNRYRIDRSTRNKKGGLDK